MTSHRRVPTTGGGLKARVTTRLLFAMAIFIAVGGGTYWGGRAWWYDAELGRAERDMAAGRYGPAGAARPTREAGRVEMRWSIHWASASPGSATSGRPGRVGQGADDSVSAGGALERARLALTRPVRRGRGEPPPDRGRRGEIGDEAKRLAQKLDLYLGRGHRISAGSSSLAVVARPGHATPDALAVRIQPYPIDAVREALERLGRESPDDDRVWLGKADIATRTGRFDEADAG